MHLEPRQDERAHVSGTIAGVGNDGIGVAGVSWNAKLVAIKFLDDWGFGSTAGAIAAVNHATTLRQRGVNIRMTNNSWGGGAHSEELRTAIANSGASGMLFIAAAGNDNRNTDSLLSYPSGYDLPNVVSVAATDRNDLRADFSNYGVGSVDLGAPGLDVWSSIPIGLDVDDDAQDGYAAFSGTSMAMPHVVGVAALAFGYKPDATYQDVHSAIVGGVNRTTAMSGVTVTGGRLNAANTIALLNGAATSVIDSTPSAASPANFGIRDFAVRFSTAVDSSTLAGSDFSITTPAGVTVHADAVVVPAPNAVTFRFNSSPVNALGAYTMRLAAGAVASQTAVPLTAWSDTFTSQQPFSVSPGEVNLVVRRPCGRAPASRGSRRMSGRSSRARRRTGCRSGSRCRTTTARSATGATPHSVCFHSPNMNAYTERFVQAIQQECLDWFVVFEPEHLDHVAAEYVDHYHHERPHQGMGNRPLTDDRQEQSAVGEVACRERLGGGPAALLPPSHVNEHARTSDRPPEGCDVLCDRWLAVTAAAETATGSRWAAAPSLGGTRSQGGWRWRTRWRGRPAAWGGRS